MIIFSGVVSDELQTKTVKRRNRYFFKFSAISSVALIVVSGIFWFLFDWGMEEWLLLSGLLIGTVLLQLWNPRKKLPFRWEYHITIDAEKIIVETPLWSKPLQKPIKKIKRVLDEGDCYYIIYGDINNCIVCQKDLIKEGTIEEFETLFVEKIKRNSDKII